MEIQSIRQGFVIAEIPINTYCSISRSKVSGTLSGTIGAAKKMIGIILFFCLSRYRSKIKISNCRQRVFMVIGLNFNPNPWAKVKKLYSPIVFSILLMTPLGLRASGAYVPSSEYSKQY